MKRILPIIALLLLFFTASGEVLPVSYMGIEHGLSNNTVTTIYKDKYGFMWFGTLDGLNRFDGYTFKKFRNVIGDPASLPDNTVTAINEDRAGNLWVGTRKGLGVLNNKTLKFSGLLYCPDPKKPEQKLPFNEVVNAVKITRSGDIFIASNNAGLLILSKGAAAARQVPLLSGGGVTNNYSVTGLTIRTDKQVWLVTEGIGLCQYDAGRALILPETRPLPPTTCMKEGPDGNLWIGTSEGLYRYNFQTSSVSHIELKDKNLDRIKLFDFYFDRFKRVWLATDGEGVGVANVLGNGDSYTLHQRNAGTLTSDAIYAIFEDDQFRKWFGTLRGGLNIIDSRKNQFKTVRHQSGNANSLVSNFTFSFCEDLDRNIWIGTDGGGLSVWDRTRNQFTNYTHSKSNGSTLSSDRVSSLISGPDEKVWIALFGGGVDKFDPTGKKFQHIPVGNASSQHESVWKMYMDREKTVWISCLRGERPGSERKRIFRYDAGTGRFVPAPFDMIADAISMTEDDNGYLWLGGFNELYQVDKLKGVKRVIRLNTAVRALHTDKKGNLWIATHGKGLIRLNMRTGQQRPFNENSGLPNNIVLNIEEDGRGNLWLSTFNGLCKFNPADESFRNYFSSDGLQANQFYFNASGHLKSGELLFGGIQGFSIFHPDSVRQFNQFPPVLITGVSIENVPVNANNEFIAKAGNIYDINHIRLPFDKAVLSLEYVALEYSLPEKIQYAYYLEGWDKGWNYVKDLRVINYSRLNEGHYTLHIKSTNAFGVWNSQEKRIAVTVLPPWYRSWWAYMLYAITLITAIYACISYFRNEARSAYEIKLAHLTIEQEKVLHEKKISFFTNISHELRTPLTLIVNPIKELLHHNGKNVDLIDLSSVYRNARRLLSLVDQLLLFRTTDNELAEVKKETLNIEEVCSEVFLCFNNQAKARSVHYVFNCPEKDLIIHADREKLEIVLFNLISNALKFTPDNGEVSLEVSKKGDELFIAVRDSGCGISGDVGERLFEKFYRGDAASKTPQSGFGIGLFLAKKYVEIHQGTLVYESEPGTGTCFTIVLPKVKVQPQDSHNVSRPVNHSATFNLLSEALLEDEETVADSSYEQNGHVQEMMEHIVQDKPAILVMDDDSGIRNYLRHILKDAYTVYEAEDTISGFEIVMQVDPDIIVCDVVMKGTSGIEFCSKLKESPSFSHIPVILLTGSSSPEIKLKGIECGADDYITKPFESDLLIARIKSILKGRSTLKQFFLDEITLKTNTSKIPEEYSQFLSKCIAIIEKYLEEEDFSVAMFTKEIGMSRSTLFRKVKAISGLTTAEFIRYIRLRKGAELMIQTDLQIKEVAYKVGFQDVRYFREQFYKLFELNPSDFIRKYRKTFIKNHNLTMNITSEKLRN